MRNRPTRSTFQALLQHFIDTIKDDVAKGHLLPGEFLPAEIELAKQFKLSKLSIRKGLDQLVRDGVIEKIPRVGTRICASPDNQKEVVRFACHTSLIKEVNMVELIELFETEYPNIRIQLIPFPFQQYLEDIDHYIDQDLIDVLTLNDAQCLSIQDNNRIHIFEEQQIDENQYDFLQPGFTFENRLIAKPFVFSPLILCYNPTHFIEKEIDFPAADWTWSTLLQAAKQLSDQHERYGFYFHLLSQNRWPVFLLQNNFSFKQDEPDYNRFIESMRLCKELMVGQGMRTLLITDDDLQAEHLFLLEKASMIMTTYFNLNYLKNSSIPYEIAPLPYIDTPRTLSINVGLGIVKSSSKREAAALFIDFLTSLPIQRYIRTNTLSIPANKFVDEDEVQPSCYQPSQFLSYKSSIPNMSHYDEIGMTPVQLMELRKDLTLYWSDLSNENDLLYKLQNIIKKSYPS